MSVFTMTTLIINMSNYYEIYWNEEHGRKYYFNPASKDSSWEMPKDGVCVDMTES
jgi:hypothetical protein